MRDLDVYDFSDDEPKPNPEEDESDEEPVDPEEVLPDEEETLEELVVDEDGHVRPRGRKGRAPEFLYDEDYEM